jgi:hypothetical protein
LEFVDPATRYVHIYSSRFAPSPRSATKSSTLLNDRYAFRICGLFSAVAVVRFTGCVGGLFFAFAELAKDKARNNKSRLGASLSRSIVHD